MDNQVSGHGYSPLELANAEIAAKKLRSMKNRWGVTWRELGEILGIPYRWKSLSVYASNRKHYRLMPPDLAQQIVDFDDSTSPNLDRDPPPTGAKIVLLWQGDIFTLPLPDIGICEICGALFITRGYGQKYCHHRCSLEARRARRMAKKSAANKK